MATLKRANENNLARTANKRLNWLHLVCMQLLHGSLSAGHNNFSVTHAQTLHAWHTLLRYLEISTPDVSPPDDLPEGVFTSRGLHL